MNPRYIETFQRHRVLFSLPLIIVFLLTVLTVVGAPKSYVSEASIYVDTPPSAQSSTDPSAQPLLVQPSTQEQQILTELLSTRSFRLKVGHEGPLANYLAHHSGGGFSPLAVLSVLRAKPSLDFRIMSALDPKHVLTAVPGPQLLSISLAGPTPGVAEGTLAALLKVYKEQRAATEQARAQQSLALYKAQLLTAQKAYLSAQARVNSTPTSNPQYANLNQDMHAAQANYNAATNSYHTAFQASQGLDSTVLSVQDQPSFPTGPKSSKKKALMAIIAGLLVGGLLSFGAVAAFTRLKDGDAKVRKPGPRPLAVAASPRVREAVAVVDGDRRRRPALSAPANDVASPGGKGEVDLADDHAITNGTALKGKIIAVWDEGDGKQTRPVWTIQQPANGKVRLAPGSHVWMIGDPGRQGVIRDIRDADDGGVVCEVEITKRKLAEKGQAGRLAIAPSDVRWVGEGVAFMQSTQRSPAVRSMPGGSAG